MQHTVDESHSLHIIFFRCLYRLFCVSPPGDHVRHRMEMEVKRMGFDTQNAWRVSDINSKYKYVKEPRPVVVGNGPPNTQYNLHRIRMQNVEFSCLSRVGT